MNKIISKTKLLATTAICAISMCANTVKAEEISILDILNNSTTKSPDITWTEGNEGEENTIKIGDTYYKYIIASSSIRDKYHDRQYNTLSGNVIGDFIEASKHLDVNGGAIYNTGTINSISGNFIGNIIDSNGLYNDSYGGAIYNREGSIGNVTGDFIGNTAISPDDYAYGGAIYNKYATISSITGNFIGNSVTGSSTLGGAIYNNSTIESISGYFINNNSNNGGAIRNSGTISSIIGDFIKNNSVHGGAISNDSKILSITGDFTGNSVTRDYDVYGGAIYNDGTIETITGDFTNNSATGDSRVYGGAIYNYNGTISSITGNFIGNNAIATDGKAYGGAIYNLENETTINMLSGDFIGNYIYSENNSDIKGGAIYNQGRTTSQSLGNEKSGWGFGNFAWEMGFFPDELLAMYELTSEEDITPEIALYMTNLALNAEGLAEMWGYNGVQEMLDDYGYASMQEMAEGLGYNGHYSVINFVADASDNNLQDDILFQGNYIQVANEDKKYEAIYNKGLINFESNNGGSYTFYDYINGENPGTINFVSDDNEGATINLYNNIQNQANINFQNKYVINMISPDDIHSNASKYSYIQAQNININAALQMMLDVDLKNAEMDRFEADNFTISATGSIDVTKFNIVTDLTGEIGSTTEVEFILSDNATGLDKITNVTEAVGEVYTYTVTFNPETGAFEFVSTGFAPEPVTPTPEEVAPNQAPVLSTTTTVATVETVVAQIFDRDVTISTDINYGADTTDYMETSDGVNIHNSKSVWVKTFGSDDDVEVENFNSTIDAEAYGVVGGVDSKVFTYDNGVKAAYGIYGAYVGGKQKYNDSKIEQKSGYLGVSVSFRKSNLFSNFTLNGGYITSEANTEWGKDKFDTKVVSVANKTGVDIKTYNNWKITPALYVAYTGMDTEDYTNKAGVKMENEFSNVITIAPELKVSNRIGKDLDGYAKVSYKHYIYDAEVRADDVLLEEMSAKPYVEYGFGVEKNWADKSGYAEITRRSGGREGWNVNLGLNFDF